MHDPSFRVNWFQDAEEGASVSASPLAFGKLVSALRCSKFSNQLFSYSLSQINGGKGTLEGGFEYDGVNVSIQGSGIDLSKENYIAAKNSFEKEIYKLTLGTGLNTATFEIPKEQGEKFKTYITDQTAWDKETISCLADLCTQPDKSKALDRVRILGKCRYASIPIDCRIKLLGWLADEKWTNSEEETIIIDLLTHVTSKPALYTALYAKPVLVAKLMLACDGDNRTLFVNEVTKLCNENWSQPATPKGYVYIGTVAQSFGSFYSGNDFISYAKYDEGKTDFHVINYIGKFTKGLFDWGQVQELKRIKEFDCNPLDAVEIYSSDGSQGLMPLLYPVNLSEVRGNQAIVEQFTATLNYIGVASSIRILAKGGSLLAKSSAFTQLTKTGVDVIFNDAQVIAKLNETENGKTFLKYWQIASIAIDVTTIGADMLDGIIKHGSDASKALRSAGKTDAADNVDDFIDEAKAINLAKNGTLVGLYNWPLVRKYFKYIQELTGRPVLQVQIDKIKDALRAKQYTKLSPTDYANHTKQFTKAKKDALIKQWETETGQTWPSYTETYLKKDGTPYKEIGDPYDAHHIIEQNYGGEHEWWNMHPAKFPDEHQAGIHGANSPARELFK